MRTTASSQTKAYKEQVRGAVVDAHEFPAGGVRLQIAFVVGPHRNWLSLWKPTIDALDRFSVALAQTVTGTPETAGSPTWVSTSSRSLTGS